MSKTPEPVAAVTRTPRGDTRYLIGAGALIVVVALLALVFGVVRPPAVDGLTDSQRAALPGGVAWTEYNEREGCTELMVAQPSGGAGAIACSDQLDRVVGWTESGIITLTYIEEGQRIETRDPATGEVLSSRSIVIFEDNPEDGWDDFVVNREDGRLLLADRWGTTVWETAADARYEIGSISVSPDGDWVAMTDSAERLLVARADGSEEPAIWATGVREWSWRHVVWEGTEPPS